jgi:hypothetical protein
MARTSLAGEWLKANGLKWDSPTARPKGKMAQKINKRNCREVKAGKRKGEVCTIKRFVDINRNRKTDDCIFVPHAIRDRPAMIEYCDKSISAAKYMALLMLGTPKEPTHMVRHLCGNGHLSCINGKHLRWGDASDNISDAVRHRACKTPQDKIAAVTRE